MSFNVEAVWQQSYQSQQRRLSPKARQLVHQNADLASFRALTGALHDRQSSSMVNRCIQKMDPVLHFLNSFTLAISSVVSSHPEIGGLIWGAIQAIMTCVSKFSRIMDKITTLLRDLIKSLERCQRYLELFPGNLNLQNPLKNVYEDYAGFLIDTVNFLVKWPFYNVIRMLWSSVEKKHSATVVQLNLHISEFDKQARLLCDESAILHQKMVATALPDTDVTAKISAAIFDVGLPRNDFFIGRDDTLDVIKQHLLPSDSTPLEKMQTCVVTGIGGVGKSQIAAEYAYRNRQAYKCIIWLDAERGHLLAEKFAQIAKLVTNSIDLNQSQSIASTRNWLSRTEHTWLLIFDNVNNAEDLIPYWPTNTHGSILITTQKESLQLMGMQSSLTSIPLSSFSEADGIKLLMRYINNDNHPEELITGPEDHQAARLISSSVGGLAIALTHIAGYMTESRCTLSTFLKILQRRNESSRIWSAEKPSSTWQYQKALANVNEIALGELEPHSRGLLNILACLDAAGISKAMLEASSEEPALKFLPSSTQEPSKYLEMIRSLRKRQLMKVSKMNAPTNSNDHYIIHRSLQRDLLYALDKAPGIRNQVFHQAFTIVRKVLPRVTQLDVPKSDEWWPYEKYLSHALSLQAVYDQSEPPITGSIELATLFSEAGTYIWERGLPTSGMSCLRTAENVLEALEPDDPLQKDNLLGDIYVMTGVLTSRIGLSLRKEELEYRYKAFHKREAQSIAKAAASGYDSSLHLLNNARNDLGIGLLQVEQFDEAELMFKKCLEWYKLSFTESAQPFEYAKYYHNISFVLASRGEAAAAIQSASRAMKLRFTANGEKSPLALRYRFTHACWVCKVGDFETALRLHLNILDHRTEVLGEYDWWTLGSGYMVGLVYCKLLQWKNAEQVLANVLARSEAASWPREQIARAKYQLAQSLDAQGKHDEVPGPSLLLREARAVIDQLQPLFPTNIRLDSIDEAVRFDYMVPIFQGRLAGKFDYTSSAE